MSSFVGLKGPSFWNGNDKPEKIVVFLHGYGATGDDLLSLGRLWEPFLPRTLFLAPHAPFPCEIAASGRQWFSIEDWNPQTLLKGAKHALPFLSNFIDENLKHYQLNLTDVALVGFSQGAMMAMHYALSYHEEVAGVLAYSGALLWPPSDLPLRRPSILLIHGDQDQVVPFEAFHEAKNILKLLDIPHQAHAIQGLAHGIDEKGLELGISFLRNRLYTLPR